MHETGRVTNEMFEAAWSNDSLRRVIFGAAKNYKGLIPDEELTYRGRMALFNCLRKHETGRGNKFTTSLYQHTVWECQKALRFQERHPPFTLLPEGYSRHYSPPIECFYVRDCLDTLPQHHRRILIDYYIKGMTLEEIGKAGGYSRQSAMKRLKLAQEAFRSLYGDD